MKRFKIFPLIAVLFTVLLASCEKETMIYDSKDSVFFVSDSIVYPFYIKDATITKDTVDIKVQLIGNLSKTERAVNVVVDSTNAVEGVDFDLIKPFVLAKDSIYAHIRVILYRSADIALESKTIWFSLRNSADIDVANIYRKPIFKLRFSDKIEKPEWWDGYFYQFPFSEIRMAFYIQVMGSANNPDSYAPDHGYEYTMQKLTRALNEYNATHSEPLSDEYGPISWYVDWINE